MNRTNQMNLSVLALLVGGFAVHAGPIVMDGVITGGSATRAGGFENNFTGTITGANFSISGYGGSSWFNYSPCNIGGFGGGPCVAPGNYRITDGIDTSYRYSYDTGYGRYVSDGTSYGCSACDVYITVWFTVTLPDPGPSPANEIVLTAPLTGNAGLFYSEQGCPEAHCAFLARGTGTATVTFARELLPPGYPAVYYLQSAQYNFTAVPEPATMTLAGLGLLTVVLLRRRAVNARVGSDRGC